MQAQQHVLVKRCFRFVNGHRVSIKEGQNRRELKKRANFERALNNITITRDLQVLIEPFQLRMELAVVCFKPALRQDFKQKLTVLEQVKLLWVLFFRCQV